MSIIITDECIICGACEAECPNNAIYEPSDEWSFADGTSLKGNIILPNGKEVDANKKQETQNDEVYFIITDKCTECVGFHEEPQCAAVCPVDCCIPDDEHQETKEELEAKKTFMHKE